MSIFFRRAPSRTDAAEVKRLTAENERLRAENERLRKALPWGIVEAHMVYEQAACRAVEKLRARTPGKEPSAGAIACAVLQGVAEKAGKQSVYEATRPDAPQSLRELAETDEGETKP